MAGGHGKAKPEPNVKGQGQSMANGSRADLTLSLELLKPFLTETELIMEAGSA